MLDFITGLGIAVFLMKPNSKNISEEEVKMICDLSNWINSLGCKCLSLDGTNEPSPLYPTIIKKKLPSGESVYSATVMKNLQNT